jgi:hypothetical protein
MNCIPFEGLNRIITKSIKSQNLISWVTNFYNYQMRLKILFYLFKVKTRVKKIVISLNLLNLVLVLNQVIVKRKEMSYLT